jgi:hypothetical protein
MDPKRWTKTVTVETAKLGKHRVIASTEEAARFLLTEWPVSDTGPAHLNARFACIDVLDDVQPPEVARDAFVAAAEEADILVKG